MRVFFPMTSAGSASDDGSFLVKIILTGESCVGKTNLLSQFVRHNFTAKSKATIGVECATKTVEVNGQTVKAQIWDTAGQERFRAIVSTYYRGAHGVLIVYDITNSASFAKIPHWLAEVNQLAEPDCAKMLIGNKVDLEGMRSVTTDDGCRLAEKEHLLFLETSAKTAANVDEAFTQLLTAIIGAKTKAMFVPQAAVTIAPLTGIVVAKEQGCSC
jgi:small GTP-binding protein